MEDFRKAKEFMELMSVLYTSTLCFSREKSPTSGQIIPILKKLECHYADQAEDSPFARNIKEKIRTDLSTRYQNENVQNFLEEATVMDPRFKSKIDSDAICDRLRSAAIVAATPRETEKQSQQEDNIQRLGQSQEVEEKQQEEVENYNMLNII
ncbi:hypothetical protein PO909_006610 [Leuciscus waleckii]